MKNGFTTFSLHKRGFTLIELMVVISIIAILAIVGLVSYTQVLKSGRDARRQADLGTIQAGLEQYRNDQGFYPTSTDGLNVLITPKVYLKKIPTEPLASPYPSYSYIAIPSTPSACNNSTIKCMDYCLYAQLEIPPNPARVMSTCTESYNFALTPP